MYIVSKLIGELIDPILWLIAALLWAVLARQERKKKRLLTFALMLALVFSNGWIIKNLTAAYQWRPEILRSSDNYEVGVLLGGMAGFDKRDLRGYFNHASDRFIQAVWLYRTGHIRRILITGGQANPFPDNDLRESDFLVETLVEMGVPRTDIINERSARNTIENAVFTKRILDSLDIRDSILLITSAVHMPRSASIFKSEGIPFRAFPCDYTVKPSGTRFGLPSFKPSADAFVQWKNLLHEGAGLMYVRFRGR